MDEVFDGGFTSIDKAYSIKSTACLDSSIHEEGRHMHTLLLLELS